MKKIALLLFSALLLISCDDDQSSKCGDGFLDVGEECESANLGGQTCASLGYYGGNLACNTDCTFNTDDCSSNGFCGDGVLNGDEECEGTDFGGKSCYSLGYYGGDLACSSDCKLVLSDCKSYGKCGDGVLQEVENEECDATDFGDKTCLTLGYYGNADLQCTADCKLDISACKITGYCGDGIIQSDFGEVCDGTNLNGFTCLDLGYYGSGNPVCSDDCSSIIEDACYNEGFCGDGIIQSDFGEVCDGTNLNGLTCLDLGYYGNENPVCSSDCSSVIEDVCYNGGFCGDGIVNGAETCDGTNIFPGACRISGYGFGTPETCDASSCTASEIGCKNIKQWGTGNWEALYDIAIDNSGILYMVGKSSDTANSDPILIKADNDGNIIWQKIWGTAQQDEAYNIAIDNGGNIYAGGTTYGAMQGTNAGYSDIFLTKYDSIGNKLWTRQWGSSGRDYIGGIAVDPLNNVYVTGTLNNIIFLRKYNPDGNILWTQNFQDTSGNDASGSSNDINIDPDGNIYIAGSTSTSLDGSTVSYKDAFILKVDPNGNTLWAKLLSGSGNSCDITSGITTDASGFVYAAGNFNCNNRILFTTKYTSDGSELWLFENNADQNINATDISIDITGKNLFISGYTSADFGGTNAGLNDGFIIKKTTDGTELWVKQFGGSDNDLFFGTTMDINNGVFWIGYSESSLDGTNSGMADYILGYSSSSN